METASYGAVSGYAQVSGGIDKISTLTEKSVRIAELSDRLCGLVMRIHGAVIPPQPANSIDKQIPPPALSHAVFALEATEQNLNRAIAIANEVVAAL